MDAQDVDLPDGSVDGVLCRYGLMLVPDIGKAFSEARRVLRPGRVLAYTTWTPPETNPWMMIFGAAMIQRGHFAPPDDRGIMPPTLAQGRSGLRCPPEVYGMFPSEVRRKYDVQQHIYSSLQPRR